MLPKGKMWMEEKLPCARSHVVMDKGGLERAGYSIKRVFFFLLFSLSVEVSCAWEDTLVTGQ